TGTGVFSGLQSQGPRLTLAQGSQTATFVGRGQPGLEETEEGQREIVPHQDGLLGLKVTRKVFVPRGGYFIRYLEILENEGDQPVTIGVSLDAALASIWTQAGSPTILPRVSPGFVVVDDTQTQDYYDNQSQIPPFATAFAGSEAAAPTVQLTDRALQYRWTGVAVPAHRETLRMHARAGQGGRGRAGGAGNPPARPPPPPPSGVRIREGPPGP